MKQKGVQYLERAKEQGNDRAKYFVGKIYLDKISSEYSPELGLQYMTELAESGNEYAQLKLGFEYLKGKMWKGIYFHRTIIFRRRQHREIN